MAELEAPLSDYDEGPTLSEEAEIKRMQRRNEDGPGEAAQLAGDAFRQSSRYEHAQPSNVSKKRSAQRPSPKPARVNVRRTEIGLIESWH